MRMFASEYAGTIGPHQRQLEGALDDIADAVGKSVEPANGIAEKLKSLAEDYQDIIDSGLFGSSGN